MDSAIGFKKHIDHVLDAGGLIDTFIKKGAVWAGGGISGRELSRALCQFIPSTCADLEGLVQGSRFTWPFGWLITKVIDTAKPGISLASSIKSWRSVHGCEIGFGVAHNWRVRFTSKLVRCSSLPQEWKGRMLDVVMPGNSSEATDEDSLKLAIDDGFVYNLYHDIQNLAKDADFSTTAKVHRGKDGGDPYLVPAQAATSPTSMKSVSSNAFSSGTAAIVF